MWLKPSEIYFSHDTIRPRFKNGQYIGTLFDDIWDGRVRVQDVEKIEVARQNGRWHVAAGNRRLYVFLKLEKAGVIDYIEVVDATHSGIPYWAFTTHNRGESVEVRGEQDTGGVWASIQDQKIEVAFLGSAEDSDFSFWTLHSLSSGFFMAGKERYFFGAPYYRDLVSEAREFNPHADIIFASFGHSVSGECFFKYSDGNTFLRTRSERLGLWQQRYSIKEVTFSPGGGFLVVFDDGTRAWQNLPEELEAALRGDNSDILSFSISSSNGWVLITAAGYEYHEIPDEMRDAIKKQVARDSYPTRASIGFNGDWAIEFD